MTALAFVNLTGGVEAARCLGMVYYLQHTFDAQRGMEAVRSNDYYSTTNPNSRRHAHADGVLLPSAAPCAALVRPYRWVISFAATLLRLRHTDSPMR